MEVIYDGEGEDVTNGEASGEVTVGVGVNNNDFGVKVIYVVQKWHLLLKN